MFTVSMGEEEKVHLKRQGALLFNAGWTVGMNMCFLLNPQKKFDMEAFIPR